MIIQAFIDWLRDVIVSWIDGINSVTQGIDLEAAGGAIGSAAGGASHFLALFIDPGMWGGVLTTWGVWLSVWLITGLIAIVARRGAGS